MRNVVILGVAAMLLSNTFQLRTNARIMTSNVLDYTSNLIPVSYTHLTLPTKRIV